MTKAETVVGVHTHTSNCLSFLRAKKEWKGGKEKWRAKQKINTHNVHKVKMDFMRKNVKQKMFNKKLNNKS